jgi:hypothetical protein
LAPQQAGGIYPAETIGCVESKFRGIFYPHQRSGFGTKKLGESYSQPFRDKQRNRLNLLFRDEFHGIP